MALFDECCLLIPAATLEDFPSNLSDYDARSLLASWTLLWHPRLLAETEQTPVWYRADGPPDPIGNRLVAVSEPCLVQLPDGYEARGRESDQACWLTGRSRQEMLESLAKLRPELRLDHVQPIRGSRRIDVDDFYAAGFATLQIQVMTRRLRYTSNLDEVHLQNRIVAAAKAFLDGDADGATEALHDVFDCLAEERDHYFSSDPHLIDLNLTSQSTVEALLDQLECTTAAGSTFDTDRSVSDRSVSSGDPDESEKPGEGDSSPLATPWNLLLDPSVAQQLANLNDPRAAELRQRLAAHQIGWAGGGPDANVCLDTLTFADAEAMFRTSLQRTSDAIGAAPMVYARFAGSTPSDMTRILAQLGYCGMIPLNFAAGTGHGDESKVIMQSTAGDLEALTAKPIDAASDASFLNIGARLGEAIDSGEIATGLLVHWPGQSCDAFQDLRKVASWSLALGRFWKLDDYFTQGERPYHHGPSSTSSPEAAELLESRVDQAIVDPISALAQPFARSVVAEHDAILRGMTTLVTAEKANREVGKAGDGEAFATAVCNCEVVSDEEAAASEADHTAILIANPHSIGNRDAVTLTGAAPPKSDHLFASSTDQGQTTSTVDVPACGFVVVQAGKEKPPGSSLGDMIRQKFFDRPKEIADEQRLTNEFMEVSISEQTGGIAGVYSGSTRGNRMSMRLVRCRPSDRDAQQCDMRCSDFQVVACGQAIGGIETKGQIVDSKSEQPLADFSLLYTLRRGSRCLRIDGQIKPLDDFSDSPWQDYIAARVAVVTESTIVKTLVRDKVHRGRSRRLVSPLGIVIDEAERQTLVAANGYPFHRRVGERFLDTLVSVRGESRVEFTVHYGLEVPAPVAAARTLIAAPRHIAIRPRQAIGNSIGWIVHSAPKDLLLSTLDVARRDDGQLAALVRLVQTHPQSCKASIRFFRDVAAAVQIDSSDADQRNLAIADVASGSEQPAAARSLDCDGDKVSLTVPSHGIADLLVVFRE